MKRLIGGTVLLFCFLCSQTSYSQKTDSIISRIILIGDAGALIEGRHPVSDAIKKSVPLDEKTIIIYLGDNLYQIGLPDDAYAGYQDARVILDSQLVIARGTRAKVFMIPGNHDWNNGGRDGFNAVVRQQFYVDLLDTAGRVKFYPEDGCPGPVEVKLNDEVVLVIMDSQWWIHPYDKPGVESDCPFKTPEEVLSQLSDILARNSRKLVVFATHHPFRSNGIHGGYFGVKQHIFPFTDKWKNLYIPLPVIGSVYPISRAVFGSKQDISHPAYRDLVERVEAVTKEHPNLIYAAGHEHNLQLIKDTGHYYIVSGSGSKTSRVSKSKKTLYADDEHGFAVLEVSKNKNVRVSFFNTGVDSISKPFSENILDFSKLPEVPKDTTKPIAEWTTGAVVAASNKYARATTLQKFFLGENYRKEWRTPVQMKLFNITQEKGGLTIISLGGGKQTKSLKLKDKRGKEWSLRSIDKDPDKAIPANFRNTVAGDLVQDMISASYPYSALSVPGLAKATKVIQANPELFYVPNDPALGFYREMFANTVCLLEEKEPNPDGNETKSTHSLLEDMANDNDQTVNQKEVLRARLLDILVADFDRHWDQWRWAETDTGKGKLYSPIAKDRDQAYFYSEGLLIKYITRNRMPFLKGLRYDIPQINWLGHSARDFDRFFMNELEENEWDSTIRQFQRDLPDNVIADAVKRLPPEVYSINGEEITKKLISRRNHLQKEGMRYYRFLSDYVNVVGSNKAEYFRVTGSEGGLQVRVYDRDGKGDTSFKLYDRKYQLRHTDEIRLYGLNGNDVFEIDESASSKIKLRIIGGKGNDTFNIQGRARNLIYDITTEKNQINKSGNSRTRDYTSSNVRVNDYKRVEFQYGQVRFPRINIAFNEEDGMFFGIGYWRRSYGFRKDPYATDQRFGALYAPVAGAYQLRYVGEFNHVLKYNDILLRADLFNPTLNNFFGMGNKTEIDEEKPKEYYRVRYKYLEGDVLVRRRIFDALSIAVGPTFYHYWNDEEDNRGKILEDLTQNNSDQWDSTTIYKNKMYVGGKLILNLNNLNSELFPTRGIQWINAFSFLAGLTPNSGGLSKFTSDMAVYASLRAPARAVMLMRLGGGHIFNDRYEFFQALNLGANNYLRGFRKNRFSGNSLAYGSLELRLKLFTSKWYVLPGDFGLIGFTELGRVWDYREEENGRWHNANGGGIYYVPFNMVIVSATMSYSKEEQLFNFGIGTKFNLIF